MSIRINHLLQINQTNKETVITATIVAVPIITYYPLLSYFHLPGQAYGKSRPCAELALYSYIREVLIIKICAPAADKNKILKYTSLIESPQNLKAQFILFLFHAKLSL
jgi:hypothetical protein